MMKLTKLKRKLISEVKETATFNEAKEILTKYDPSALRGFNSQGPTSPTAISSPAPRVPIMSPRRQSNLFNNSLNVSSSTTKGAASVPPSTPALMPPLGAFPGSVRLPQQAPRTVKPILSQHRSIVEKAVDYMFSDGPNNRYALICAQCCMHNGMALADEFEYISYVCAYCTAFNPARKTRPPPPITLAQQQQQQPGTQMLKAIEGPKVELPDDDEGVKITELTCDTSIIQAANTSAAEITSPSKVRLTCFVELFSLIVFYLCRTFLLSMLTTTTTRTTRLWRSTLAQRAKRWTRTRTRTRKTRKMVERRNSLMSIYNTHFYLFFKNELY